MSATISFDALRERWGLDAGHLRVVLTRARIKPVRAHAKGRIRYRLADIEAHEATGKRRPVEALNPWAILDEAEARRLFG